MSTATKMFLLAWFVVILVLAAGCYEPSRVDCEPPYYSGAIKYGWATRDGTVFWTPDGQRHEYSVAVKCVFSNYRWETPK